ncbi:MAG: Uridine phosphorylase [Candidatus Gottesmanbacteria bacterium GW2011_GWA2_47_9]|uniref:Uridine phosphorylase n=2 Tax=Microgenomates group TaxID=1794810 RepID=A0A0G0UX11_9BACT|nr:MAG: Uridine phosphorylase [Candidatus Woesebacteria bacterium GW2011_GWA1_41_13b]KKU88381.1 MAG: Uridine phosphorylase [Candidatus Gottesmanbacteria bacterium GW2011_GWA2_47_9]
MTTQPHIKCRRGDVGRYALIPGDPARVRQIASYLDNPKEIAFNREFLTITGKYKGIRITATSTGIGCPSAAIAIEELANIGVNTFIRVGTCGALQKIIHSGDLIIPFAAVRAEGTTKEYIAPEFPAVATPEVFYALASVAKKKKYRYFTGINRTHDAFYEHMNNLLKWGEIYRDDRMKTWKYPLISSEMECSVALLLPMLRGLRSGCILAVNTPEPLKEIVQDPGMIYKLEESKGVKSGIDEAIKTALEAIVMLENRDIV